MLNNSSYDFLQEFEDAQDSDFEEEDTKPDQSFRNSFIPEVPERGLFPHTRKFLIDKLDDEGGPAAITRDNKLLDAICLKHPKQLGSEGSELLKRVRTCAYHWKASPKLCAAARKKLANVKPSLLTTDPAHCPAPRPPRSVPTAAAPLTPPKLVKVASPNYSMFSPNRKKSKLCRRRLLCFKFLPH